MRFGDSTRIWALIAFLFGLAFGYFSSPSMGPDDDPERESWVEGGATGCPANTPPNQE
jgi:hypothetical protein